MRHAAVQGTNRSRVFAAKSGLANEIALQRLRALSLAADAATKPTFGHAKRVLGEVAARLGNSVAVGRKACAHPRLLALVAAEAQRDQMAAPRRAAPRPAPPCRQRNAACTRC